MLQRDVARLVEPALPGAEVLAARADGQGALLRLRRPPRRASTTRSANASRCCCARTSTSTPSRSRHPASTGRCGRERTSSARSGARCASRRRRAASAARSSRPESGRRADSKRRRAGGHTVRPDRAGQSDRRRDEGMSQEIVDAVREIEREKGIESGTLVAALEDALLAAYKKTPGASRHATVELDDRGDFRVFAIELPEDIEVRLLDEARERALDELERLEEETRREEPHAALGRRPRDRLVGRPGAPDRPRGRHAQTTSAASPRRPPSR